MAVRPAFIRSLIVVAAFVATACSSPSSPPVGSAPTAAPRVPSTRGPHLYVSDETGGRVVVVNVESGEVAGRYDVGKRPRALTLSRDGAQIFVALSGKPIGGPNVDESKLPPSDLSADGIGEIDLATGKLVRKLKSGVDPESFDLSADGTTLYVSNEDTAEMSIVDIASGDVRSHVKVGEEPEGVTVSPSGKEVYVTCEGTSEVFAIDTASGKVLAQMKAGHRPRGVAFTRDGKTAFVTNENDGTLTVIDAVTHKVTGTITLPKPDDPKAIQPRPMGLVFAPGDAKLYVSLGRFKGISVIDVATRKVERTIDDVGERPWGIAVSPDGKTLYTANGGSADISFVDIASGKLTKKINVGGSPWGVIYVVRP